MARARKLGLTPHPTTPQLLLGGAGRGCVKVSAAPGRGKRAPGVCLLPLALGLSRRVGCPCKQHPVGQGEGAQVPPPPPAPFRRERKYISSSVCPELGSFCIALSVGKIYTALFSSAHAHGCQLRIRHKFSPDAAADLVESDVAPRAAPGAASFPGARLPPCHQLPRVETARD